jgi:putative transposase
MLQAALEDEVSLFLEAHSANDDESGRRNVVRNAYMPPRKVITGAGSVEVQQPVMLQ